MPSLWYRNVQDRSGLSFVFISLNFLETNPFRGAPLRHVYACCRSTTPPASKWVKQHLTFTRKRWGQEHDERSAKRAKYLSRVGELRRLWPVLHCPNPSCAFMWMFQAGLVLQRKRGGPDASPEAARRHSASATRSDWGTQQRGEPMDELA